MKKICILLAFVLTLFGLESCSRRTYIGPPPPPRVEVIPVAPSPRYVWVKGYYYQRHNQYTWRPGHYERGRRPHR